MIAFATLVQEVLLVRLVSARLLNNYAFLIVSLTLAGFAVGAIILSIGQRSILARLEVWQGRLFALYVVSTTLTWALFCNVAAPSTIEEGHLEVMLYSIGLSGALTIPFVFSGLSIGAFLSAPALSVPRLYSFDLAGSALGCILAVAVLGPVSPEVMMLATLTLTGVVGLLLFRAPTGVCRLLYVVAGLSLAVGWLGRGALYEIRYPPGSTLSWVEQSPTGEVEYIQWDPVARIEVGLDRAGFSYRDVYPALTGDDPALYAKITRFMTQNNFAFTYIVDYDGDPRAVAGLRRTIYATGYVALGDRHPHPRVLVIGVGGGIDLVTALAHDAAAVTGVEINGAVLDVLRERYRELFLPLVSDPRVKLVQADGRHHLAREGARYDLIQLSGVDSYSGLQKSAHVFSETYLYTEEAMLTYLRRLSDDGVVNIMRLEHAPPREVLRLVTTAAAALRELGRDDPLAHIMVVGQHDQLFNSVLISPTPWSPAEVERVERWLSDKPYMSPRLLAGPHHDGPPRGTYDAFLHAARAGGTQQYLQAYPYVIWPATDDWPFFFQFHRWQQVGDYLAGRTDELPAFQMGVLFLLLMLTVLMLFTVVVPLVVFNGRGLRIERASTHCAYFALIGVAFLFIEVYFLQKFTLFLGDPTLSLATVLATMLGAAGLGSLALARLRSRVRTATPLVLALAVLGTGFALLDGLLIELVALPLTARLALTVLLVGLPGFLMGLFFPLGVDAVKQRAPEFVPWAWGINGVFSVLSPILAVTISMLLGQKAVFTLAIVLYLLAGATAASLAYWRIGRAAS